VGIKSYTLCLPAKAVNELLQIGVCNGSLRTKVADALMVVSRSRRTHISYKTRHVFSSKLTFQASIDFKNTISLEVKCQLRWASSMGATFPRAGVLMPYVDLKHDTDDGNMPGRRGDAFELQLSHEHVVPRHYAVSSKDTNEH
jgi:hypothetical protein